MKKGFWTAAFTLAGTTIGAGILGLPYVFSESGFFIGMLWLLTIGGIILFINLSLGEITLRTKGVHQLPGYAEKYLGKFGKNVMFLGVIFGIYSALLAYLIGEGQSLSKLFFGHLGYSIYFGIGFWIVMTTLLHQGLKGLKRVENYGVLAILLIIFSMLIWFYPDINISNLNHYNMSNFFLPFGIILFAMLGFSSLPEMRMEIMKNEKLFKKSIFLGTLIPIFIYFVFTFIFVGVLGVDAIQIITLSFGNLVVLLGVFTMLTSYFVLSFSLRDIFMYDLNKNSLIFVFVSLFPLIVYLIVTFFNLANFVEILGIGGVISGGITGVMVLFVNLYAKKKGNRKPEFSIPMNLYIIVVLTLIFILGIFVQLFS